MTTVENLSDIEIEETLDDFGKPTLSISSPKFKGKFIIYKSNDGFSFFKVKMTVGKVAKELEGAYSTMYKAKDAVEFYINKSKASPSVRRDKTYEENH